ncbi:hypothetical protein BST95_02920 [Halioglobus japonicus]|uniref:Uncharacterized protein n=1 Tax=Halioglobus japonicus TaxID=930805 RepID=A0AAP8MCG7_9GAMM|nr:hypothetical protein [Halioglobus japonicus]AQA17334.1 hypothetical protein BST95_02920 [Halioglobus japonicus]PLW85255.1 hypothetical protein C0029_11490 [Halioglobus japonicus]GHD24193.1 hypothetical protein GCM10007052_37660 [Halioglobus japonicus]
MQERNTLGHVIKFVKESTGLAITFAYLILIISSMAYLGIFYGRFNVDILKLVSLEDILVTPIRRPDIIVAIVAITIAVSINDALARYNARLSQGYVGKKKPWYIRFYERVFFFFPATAQGHYRLTVASFFGFLCFYIAFFAYAEAEDVLEGNGYEVFLTLSEKADSRSVILLGTTSLYVIVYDSQSGQVRVHQMESVASITPAENS